MTIVERIEELKAAGAEAAPFIVGDGRVDGDPTPPQYVVALGRSLGLKPKDVLDLSRPLADLLNDG